MGGREGLEVAGLWRKNCEREREREREISAWGETANVKCFTKISSVNILHKFAQVDLVDWKYLTAKQTQ